MKKIYFFFLFIFLAFNVFPQNKSYLDSLYNSYLKLRNYDKVLDKNSEIKIKCGFVLSAQVFQHFKDFTPAQQSVLSKIMSRPSTQTTAVSPNGYFRVHYDTTGDNALGYSIDSLLIALDSVYNFEINYLQFPVPPSDGVEGGDSKYDIYILNLSTEYGHTEFETEVAPNRYTSFMVIDHNYKGFYTSGLNAARVTVAHEFHHAIQIGDYLWRDSDHMFYELTSTSMEEFVFNTINDYYGYLPDYFTSPNQGFYKYGGYELAIWNLYLAKKIGDLSFIKKQWEYMTSMGALEAINKSLQDYNLTFRTSFNEFGIWSYYTSYRWNSKYFNEGFKYPVIRPLNKIAKSEPAITLNINSDYVSNSFLSVKDVSKNDSLMLILTNFDIMSGEDTSKTTTSLSYTLSNDSSAGYNKISDNYFSNLDASDLQFWTTSEIINQVLARQDNNSIPFNSISSSINYAFPSPFYYTKNYLTGNYINFPVINKSNSSSAYINVYSLNMGLVFSKKMDLEIMPGSNIYVIKWNGRKLDNSKLPTGVYLYVIKCGNDDSNGKLVIFND